MESRSILIPTDNKFGGSNQSIKFVKSIQSNPIQTIKIQIVKTTDIAHMIFVGPTPDTTKMIQMAYFLNIFLLSFVKNLFN